MMTPSQLASELGRMAKGKTSLSKTKSSRKNLEKARRVLARKRKKNKKAA